MDGIDRDTAIYVGTGIFAIGVFLVAISVLVDRTPLAPDRRTLATLSIGFLLFMAVYFVSMAVYRGIEQ